MRLIDMEYTCHPFYGARKLTAWLKRQGHSVNVKRISRLMNLMGIQAIYQKPNLSKAAKAHKKYPYLLRNIEIVRPDQVWATDITYIRMHHGFVYLVAVMDWYSRYVLSHEISTTLDSAFCTAALLRALEKATPGIFNTDQGAQFTSTDFTSILESHNIKISMDGKGRAFDNIFVERLWRTLKYEEVYIHDYSSVTEAIEMIKNYITFYNNERPHQALRYNTPQDLYRGKAKI
jgi:putative transposase